MKTSRSSRSRRLQYEFLEPRQVMAAGITASLSGAGVLTVTGTDGADQINFRQSSNVITINGVVGNWTAAAVKSIVVDCKGGNDVVSFNSGSNGGNQVMSEAATVNTGAGNDKVRLATGVDINVAGGHAVELAANNTAKLDGVALNFTNTVTAGLQSGVLIITGTNGNDNIQIVRSNNRISVKGVAGSWSATDVKSISVSLQDGTDTISLDSVTNGGNQALGITVTVKSGSGADKVKVAAGKEVNCSGLGHTVVVNANGTATLDNKAVSWITPAPTPNPTPTPSVANWFDTNVVDAALRTLGHTLYLDGRIDRNDMISLLRNAEDGNVIDATELTDLRKMVDTTTLFGTLDYVRKLTSYVVNGSVANRNFQGQALGGFGAGSAGTQMEKLINKWFLGLDRPTAGGGYRQFAGTLFVNGATYSDIHQGAVGDCYFVSSLGEAALRNSAAITNMFIVNGDGTYTVKFYGPTGVDYVTVDSYLPTNSAGQLIYASRGSAYNNAGNELWVALAEKAYAQLNEFGWSRAGMSTSGQNSYDGLSGGYINAALTQITGQSTVNFAMTNAANSFTTFVNAWNAGKSIGFASISTPASSSVVGGHAYAVVGYNSANQTVTLFNPWGTEYGLVTMTWAQIQQNFYYFDRTA